MELNVQNQNPKNLEVVMTPRLIEGVNSGSQGDFATHLIEVSLRLLSFSTSRLVFSTGSQLQNQLHAQLSCFSTVTSPALILFTFLQPHHPPG